MAATLVVALAVLSLALTCTNWRVGAAAQVLVVIAALWQRRLLLRLAFLAEASYPDRVRAMLYGR